MLIRQAQVARAGGWLVLRAQVSSQGKEAECFYSVPERFADFADAASSNCFLVGLLYPAMRWGEDIHVEGTVSARLLYNINEYLVPFMSMCDSRLKPVKVTADATDGEDSGTAHAVGTGFSGGIDSFTTIHEHFERPTPEGFRLTHLFFFNVGAHGIPKDENERLAIERKFQARYEKLKNFPAEVKLPFVPVNSNTAITWHRPDIPISTCGTISA